MLYCNTATVATTRRAGRRAWGARAGAAGSWARGREAQRARGRAEQAAAGARGARQAGAGRSGSAWPGRWARGLGARARGLGAQARQGCALGALRLVFNLVFRLGIFPESLNEHCSL